MFLLRKFFILVFILSSIFFTGLYAHGGSEGSENDWLAQMLFTNHPASSFESISQSGIFDETIDIHNIDPMTVKQIKDQIRRDLENARDWADMEKHIYMFIADAAEAGAAISKITVVTAAVITAILAAHPEVIAAEAEALTAGQQLGWAVAYTGTTASAQNAAEMALNGKSPGDAGKDIAAAMIQSFVIGNTMPNNPIASNVLDGALSEVDISSSQAPTHLDGLVDYGPGHETTNTGQTLMR